MSAEAREGLDPGPRAIDTLLAEDSRGQIPTEGSLGGAEAALQRETAGPETSRKEGALAVGREVTSKGSVLRTRCPALGVDPREEGGPSEGKEAPLQGAEAPSDTEGATTMTEAPEVIARMA